MGFLQPYLLYVFSGSFLLFSPSSHAFLCPYECIYFLFAKRRIHFIQGREVLFEGGSSTLPRVHDMLIVNYLCERFVFTWSFGRRVIIDLHLSGASEGRNRKKAAYAGRPHDIYVCMYVVKTLFGESSN